MSQEQVQPYEKYLYKDKQSDGLSKIGAFVSYAALRLNNGKVIFSGLEHIKDAEPSLIAPTHQSSTDIPVMGWAARKAGIKPPSFIAKVKLVSERRLTGRILPYTGAFYIEQSKNDNAPLKTHIQNMMSSERSVVLFPEGSRRPQGHEIELQKGLGVYAVRQGLGIVPVGIHGPYKTKLGGRAPIGVAVGEPMSPGRDPIKLRNHLTEVLKDLYNRAEDLARS